MTTFNNIDPQCGSQVIFDIIYQFNDKSLFYIRNNQHNITHVSDDFCQMVNIPSTSPRLLNNFPKLKKLEALEKQVITKKKSKSLFLPISLNLNFIIFFIFTLNV
ncbi:hypothetical protein AB6H32_22945 [Providencia hangzhouensis]